MKNRQEFTISIEEFYSEYAVNKLFEAVDIYLGETKLGLVLVRKGEEGEEDGDHHGQDKNEEVTDGFREHQGEVNISVQRGRDVKKTRCGFLTYIQNRNVMN